MAEEGPTSEISTAADEVVLDLDSWKGDLTRLHGTIDQVVQTFITSQTRQLDYVANELANQKQRLASKEQRFVQLSDAIATFVETEAKRLEKCGFLIDDPEVDADREAYDGELPGPQALHRINRLWRKATRAIEAQRKASEKSCEDALEAKEEEMKKRTAELEERCKKIEEAHEKEISSLKVQLEASQKAVSENSDRAGSFAEDLTKLRQSLEQAKLETKSKVELLMQAEQHRSRLEYEWEAERDELIRTREEAFGKIGLLERSLDEAKTKEKEIVRTCESQAENLEKMKRLMDEQERDLTQQIDRVQQYVKERQAGAVHAEKKQQDAERLAERWQNEVRRLQGEKDRLMKMVKDSETKVGDVATLKEQHLQEVTSLREALKRKEGEMRAANLELLTQRDSEYQAKVNVEKEREKERSMALLKRKDQEVQIKDQQLKAARQRIQELEATISPGTTSRGTSATSARPNSGAHLVQGGQSENSMLPPLPVSAR